MNPTPLTIESVMESLFSDDVRTAYIDDAEGEGRLALTAHPALGRATVSIHDADAFGGVVLVSIPEVAEALGIEQPEGVEPEPEVERIGTRPTGERVVSTGDGHSYEFTDRIFEDRTFTIQPGGLGDNVIIQAGTSKVVLGLATIEAIAEKHGLKPGPKLEIDGAAESEPDWEEASVIRADLRGERVVAIMDEDGDWKIYGGAADDGYVFAWEAGNAFSGVEILKA